MKEYTMEISKEIYDNAGGEGKPVSESDKNKIFDVSIIWGYGLYGTSVHKQGGKYICRYITGDTCD